MAEKADKKPDAGTAPPAAAPAAAPGGGKKAGAGGIAGLFGKTPVMLGGVMLLEAAVLFAGFKFLGAGPRPGQGAELTEMELAAGKADGAGGVGTAGKPKTVELLVLEFRAQNKQSGRTFLYDVTVYVVTKSEFEQRVKDTIAARGALIKDRVRTIIAQNDPEKLGGGSEPGSRRYVGK
jgi:hypothetical protein